MSKYNYCGKCEDGYYIQLFTEETAGKCTLLCQIVNSQHYLLSFVLSVMMDMSSTKELNVLNMTLQSPVKFKAVVFVLKVMISLTAEQDMS